MIYYDMEVFSFMNHLILEIIPNARLLSGTLGMRPAEDRR